MKRPWMPLYIADYLKDTTHLGALESGAYLHLIMDYWQNGKLPPDDRQLARIAKMTDREWKQSKSTLQAFFHDGWKHKRIDGELEETSRIASSNSDKASQAARRRWAKHDTSVREAMLQACPEHTSSNAKADAPECTLHTSQSEERKDAAIAAPVVDEKTDLFIRGKTLLGENSGGLINKLLKAKGSVPKARAALEIASTTSNAREYIGGCLKGAGGEDLRASGDAW